jgi:hypothetical protein
MKVVAFLDTHLLSVVFLIVHSSCPDSISSKLMDE